MRAKELPADLIKDWARRQTEASAKLEGRELPADYARSEKVEQFLANREAPLSERLEMEALWG
jgi:hypothetical protein